MKLEDTENWLYEDGEDQPKQVYIDKLSELKVICKNGRFCLIEDFSQLTDTNLFHQKLGQPIQERYTEAELRPKAFEEMGKQIQQYMKFVEAYKMKVSLQTLCYGLLAKQHRLANRSAWFTGRAVRAYRRGRCDKSGQAGL